MCGAITTKDDLTIIWRPLTWVPADIIRRRPWLNPQTNALHPLIIKSNKAISMHKFLRIEKWAQHQARFRGPNDVFECVLIEAQQFWEAFDPSTGCGYPFDLGPEAGLLAVIHSPLFKITAAAATEAGYPDLDLSRLPTQYISLLTKAVDYSLPFEVEVADAHPGVKKRIPVYVRNSTEWLNKAQGAA